MNRYAKQILTLVLAVIMLAGCSKDHSGSQEQSELTGQVTAAVLENISQTDAIYTHYQEGLDACYQYIDGALEKDSWHDAMDAAIQELSPHTGVSISQTLLDACQDSSFSPTELAVLPDLVTSSLYSCQDHLDYLREFIELNVQMSRLYCKLILDNYAETAQEELLAFWYGASEFLLPITDAAVLTAFCEDAQKLPCFQEIATDLASSKEEAIRLQEFHLQQIERLVGEHALLTGQLQSDVNAGKEELKQLLMDNLGLSQEQAQELVEQILRINSKEQLLDAKEQELAEMQQQLEEAQQRMREKFAPLPEDEPGILWAKASHFASVSMYEDAAECLEVLKARQDSDFTPECCEAGMAFYRNAPQMGYPYGMMILQPPPEGDLAPYQVGDILVSIQGKPVYGVASYDALKEEQPDGYQAQVLRLSAQGTLELADLTVPAGVYFYCTDLVENAGSDAQ